MNSRRLHHLYPVAVAGLLAALLTAPGEGWAQPTLADIIQNEESAGGEAKAAAESEKEMPFDELDRGTPRSSVRGFLTAAAEQNYELAAQYLDLDHLPPGSGHPNGPRLAYQLKVVLDRTLWVDMDSLSDKPQGRKKDGLPANRELVGRIQVDDNRTVDVLLQRVTNEGGTPIWKFASVTLAKVPQLYDRFGYGVLERYLPSFMFELEIGQVPVVEWVGVLAVAALAFVLAYLVTGFLKWILRRRRTVFGEQMTRFASGPLRLFIGVLLFSAGEKFFQLTVFARAILNGVEGALLVIAVAWTVLRLVDVFGSMLMQHLVMRGQGSAVSLLPPARKVLKVLVVAFAVIAMLGSFGFNVTALLAGLGVGGIAVALAAQKTLENMFGGATLFANQPVRVGDFCRFGDKIGTVEEIGLYATRVRTLDRTVITIPNAEFASLQLENFSRRDKIWYHPTIGLRYETTPEQIRYILVEVRRMLYAHPKVDPDPARIRFVSFGAFSLDFEIFAYVQVTDFGEFLEVAEDLNLRIIDIVGQAGSSFAFPSQTTYVEQGEGLNRDLAGRAEQTVAEWRNRRELYIPNFPRDKITELHGRLDYPPKGSPFSSQSDDGGRHSAPATE